MLLISSCCYKHTHRGQRPTCSGALMTPVLYPNCSDPMTAVATQYRRHNVTFFLGCRQKHRRDRLKLSADRLYEHSRPPAFGFVQRPVGRFSKPCLFTGTLRRPTMSLCLDAAAAAATSCRTQRKSLMPIQENRTPLFQWF